MRLERAPYLYIYWYILCYIDDDYMYVILVWIIELYIFLYDLKIHYMQIFATLVTVWGIDGNWLWGVGLVVVRFHPVITVCYQIWGKSDVSPVLGKCPRWWRMMWSAGRGATDRPNLVIWLSNCIDFWIWSSPSSCSVLVILPWILRSVPLPKFRGTSRKYSLSAAGACVPWVARPALVYHRFIFYSNPS